MASRSLTVTVLACAWPAVLAAAVLLLPFLDKAHTVDDITFLLAAEHVLRDPLHPYAFDIVSLGDRLRVSVFLATGPVMAYLLVPSVLGGGAEWLAHVMQLALVAIGILATVLLGLRLGLAPSGARLAGLLLATTPATVAMATTGMPDVPAMSFGVVAMERLYAWKQDGRWHQALVASASLALAGLSRPHLVLLLGAGALALLPSASLTDGRTWRAVPGSRWVPLFGAAGLLWAVNALTADPGAYGASLSGATLGRFTKSHVATNLAAFSAHWVLAVPLGLPWLALRWRTLWRSAGLWLGIGGAAASVLWAHPSRWQWVVPVAGLGAGVLADMLGDAWRRRDHAQLVLGAWLLLALPVVAYVHLPPKYLVPSAPAAALLVARALGARPTATGRGVTWGVVAAGAVLAVLIIRADARFADLGRRAARDLVAPQVARGARVWVDGDWGLLWYAMRAGARPLMREPPYPGPGDVVVTSEVTGVVRAHERLSRRRIGALVDAAPGGRVVSERDGAGFYSNHTGYLPWAWGTGELERIEAWEIGGSTP